MCGKLDPAADRLEIGAHHVHADAAPGNRRHLVLGGEAGFEDEIEPLEFGEFVQFALGSRTVLDEAADKLVGIDAAAVVEEFDDDLIARSEEHTSELQSLMRISYAVFCLKKKTIKHHNEYSTTHIIHK